jgi:hypothetical protein
LDKAVRQGINVSKYTQPWKTFFTFFAQKLVSKHAVGIGALLLSGK